jgi:hypothetical protein
MVWLNLSPIPVGRREVISSFNFSNDFYLSSLQVEERGVSRRPVLITERKGLADRKTTGLDGPAHESTGRGKSIPARTADEDTAGLQGE